MRPQVKIPKEYLAALPPERATAISKVRQVILENLPSGYEESMNWGMISYEVPLSVFPDTYNKKPLMYAALANQKNHMAIYLCGIYCDPKEAHAFQEAYKKTGKKLNMGASCVRFKTLDLIGKTIASTPMTEFIEISKKAHRKKR